MIQRGHLLALDLSSFASVSAFVTRIQDEGVTVDILVGNAAIMDTHYTQTENGWEKSLQVNYLSNVLLTVLLLPHLSRGSDIVNSGRIILLSSVVHYFITHLPEADSPDILSKLNDRQHCTKSVMALRYSISKLCILFFSRELAHRINGNTGGPIVAAVDPGYCSTNLDHEAVSTAIRRFFIRIVNCFIARTPEMGSRMLIHAATRQESRALHGKYLTSCRVERESAYSLTGEGFAIQRRLWQETMSILQQVDPRVTTVLADYF
ncbi:hypothetical protein B0H14DRAFT_1301664 [Mycena olivaceomarginata]|nr:hypothetical protein B0H14DRAFT_1301664 [Mycena olivaceomarginata]